MSEQMKPCACGSVAVSMNSRDTGLTLVCDDCHAKTPPAKTWDEAIKRWNAMMEPTND